MKNQKSPQIKINVENSIFSFRLKELFNYGDLIWFLVKRDFISFYKQTILGPLWFFIQPLITSFTYLIIFNKVAGIPGGGSHPLLFYLSGVIAWDYFANCLILCSGTFINNSTLFSKVYFPRLIIPISIVISGLARLTVQFALFFTIYFYLLFNNNINIEISFTGLIFLPFLVFHMAILSLGIGILVSSLTIKYRDLRFVINFGVSLLMYGSAIVYPLSMVPDKYTPFILANPMTAIIDGFRYILIRNHSFNLEIYTISVLLTFIITFISVLVFNKVEKYFIDNI